MEIIINELSLNGCFNDLEEFYDSLGDLLTTQKLMDKLNISFAKHQELYTYKVTRDHSLYDAFKDKSTRSNDKVRRFKKLLNSLMSDPIFWHENQRHLNSDRYICEFTEDTHGYSLAEACEREKIVLSFKNVLFENGSIEIKKNNEDISLININQPLILCELLFESGLLDYETYCNHRFEGTNLSFIHLEKDYNFSILSDEEARAFISTFTMFSEMTWESIMQSDGLEYKKYQPSKKVDWFLNSIFSQKQIYKFRTSQKYRCFGYREEDVFYVLRFETDHRVSDNG